MKISQWTQAFMPNKRAFTPLKSTQIHKWICTQIEPSIKSQTRQNPKNSSMAIRWRDSFNLRTPSLTKNWALEVTRIYWNHKLLKVRKNRSLIKLLEENRTLKITVRIICHSLRREQKSINYINKTCLIMLEIEWVQIGQVCWLNNLINIKEKYLARENSLMLLKTIQDKLPLSKEAFIKKCNLTLLVKIKWALTYKTNQRLPSKRKRRKLTTLWLITRSKGGQKSMIYNGMKFMN